MQKNHTSISRYGGLSPIAMWVKEKEIWELVEEKVPINQKTIIHTPHEKLKDAFIHIMTGQERLHTINTGIRTDRGVQRLFGRDCCAEQSGVSTTLNRCDKDSVSGMREVQKELLRSYGKTVRHDFKTSLLCLDVDLSGLLCGRQAEGGEKGYFVKKKGKRGRQLGRVTSQYKEIIYEQLYPGRKQLEKSLHDLVANSAELLQLTSAQRKRTVIRIDAGGGTESNINQLQQQGYYVLVKGHNWKRNQKLGLSVAEWFSDPSRPEREFGLVTQPISYEREATQVAIRKQKPNGKYSYTTLISDLPHLDCCQLAQLPYQKKASAEMVCLAILNAYDKRGSGVELSFKEGKTGLNIAKRNKKLFEAQEMLLLLAQLVYNIIIWVASELEQFTRGAMNFGILRMVRDVFSISAQITWQDKLPHQVTAVVLNKGHPHAKKWVDFATHFLTFNDMTFNLGEI